MSTNANAVIYTRVSTTHQDADNQIPSLTALAERRGWQIAKTYSDVASGMKDRCKRPGLDQLLKDATRGKFDRLLITAVDRLGRDAIAVNEVAKQLEQCGVALYIERFGDAPIDTSTAQGKFFFWMMTGMAEFERAQMLERQAAGIARAQKAGQKFGRPTIEWTTEKKIKAALARGGKGILKIAAEYDVGTSVVQRIKAEMAGM